MNIFWVRPNVARLLRGVLVVVGHLTSNAIAATGGLLVALISALMIDEIVSREFRASNPWSSEMAIYLMIAAVFLVSSRVEAEGGMVRVNVVRDLFHGRYRRYVDAMAEVVSFVGALGLTWIGLSVVGQALDNGSISSGYLQIPLAYVYLSIPIGGCLLAGRYVARFVATL